MSSLSADTRLSLVLDVIPGAPDYIVSLNPHDFGRLRNPVLRRYMSPRISLRRVAAMVGLPETKIVEDLARTWKTCGAIGCKRLRSCSSTRRWGDAPSTTWHSTGKSNVVAYPADELARRLHTASYATAMGYQPLRGTGRLASERASFELGLAHCPGRDN